MFNFTAHTNYQACLRLTGRHRRQSQGIGPGSFTAVYRDLANCISLHTTCQPNTDQNCIRLISVNINKNLVKLISYPGDPGPFQIISKAAMVLGAGICQAQVHVPNLDSRRVRVKAKKKTRQSSVWLVGLSLWWASWSLSFNECALNFTPENDPDLSRNDSR